MTGDGSNRVEVIEECRRQLLAAISFAHGSEDWFPRVFRHLVNKALDDLKIFPAEVTDILRMRAPQ